MVKIILAVVFVIWVGTVPMIGILVLGERLYETKQCKGAWLLLLIPVAVTWGAIITLLACAYVLPPP
jgi:hypothetical protein